MNFPVITPEIAGPPRNVHLALLGRLAGLMAQMQPDLPGVGARPLRAFDAALTDFISTLTPAQVPISGGLPPRTVTRVVAFIDDNIDAVVTVAALAQVAGLSKSHFCRSFAASQGVPPHTFIMRRRIERAQILMAETGEPLATIALACGLSDQAHLNRLFRRFAGLTPGQWRRHRALAGVG